MGSADVTLPGRVVLDKKLVERLYVVLDELDSIRDTIEVSLDKNTLKRIKEVEKEYSEGKYSSAKTAADIRKQIFSA